MALREHLFSKNGLPTVWQEAEEHLKIRPLLDRGSEFAMTALGVRDDVRVGNVSCSDLGTALVHAQPGLPAIRRGRVLPMVLSIVDKSEYTRRIVDGSWRKATLNGPFSDQIGRIAEIRSARLPVVPDFPDVVRALKDIQPKLCLRTGRKYGWWMQGVRFETDQKPSVTSDLYVEYMRADADLTFVQNITCEDFGSEAHDFEALVHATAWHRFKLQGSTTFGSTDPGFVQVVTGGVLGWYEGPGAVRQAGLLIRSYHRVPAWTSGMGVTLHRGGHSRKTTQEPIVDDGVGMTGSLRAEPHVELSHQGVLNGRERSRVVTAPPPEESISVLPAIVTSYVVGMEALHLRLSTMGGRALAELLGYDRCRAALEIYKPLAPIDWEGTIAAAAMLFAGKQAIPWASTLPAPLFAVMLGPRSPDDLVFALDQSNQDQHGYRWKLRLARNGTLENWLHCKAAHTLFARGVAADAPLIRARIAANVEAFAFPEAHASVEGALAMEGDVSVSIQDHGLRSGEPGTKRHGTGDTKKLTVAVVICTLRGLHAPERVINQARRLMICFQSQTTSSRPADIVLAMRTARHTASAYRSPIRMGSNGDDLWFLIEGWLLAQWGLSRTAFMEALKEVLDRLDSDLNTEATLAEYADFGKTDSVTIMPNWLSRAAGHAAPEDGSDRPISERSDPDRLAYSGKLLSWVVGPDGFTRRLKAARLMGMTDRGLAEMGNFITHLTAAILPDVWHSGPGGRMREASPTSVSHAEEMTLRAAARCHQKVDTDAWQLDESYRLANGFNEWDEELLPGGRQLILKPQFPPLIAALAGDLASNLISLTRP